MEKASQHAFAGSDDAALESGCARLAQNSPSSCPSDIGKHITMIRKYAAENNLEGAVSVFKSLEESGVDLNTVMFNAILDACVQCWDLRAAESWIERMKKDGMIVIVSFNTLIKAHLQNGHFSKARQLMEEMKKRDLRPNRVTFNELINAMVSRGKGGDGHRREEMW